MGAEISRSLPSRALEKSGNCLTTAGECSEQTDREQEKEDTVTALSIELDRERDRAQTAEQALAECLRIMTDDQIRTLCSTARFLDNLGGVSGGPG